MSRTIAQLTDLSSRVAVVTGAASGLGRAIAGRLAEAGASTVLADIDSAGAAEAAADLSGRGWAATAERLDVTDVDAIMSLAAKVADELGRINIWVNNAGIYPPAPLFATTADHWDRMLDVNLRSVYFGTREAARQMIGAGVRGVVVNVASIASERAGNPNLAPYAAAKAGVVTLTKTLAGALGPSGVRVVGVSPGVVETEGFLAGRSALDEVGANLGNRAGLLPLRRVGTADDIARVVLFLASDLAEFVTGVTLPADGGDLIAGVSDVPSLEAMGLGES